jgi:hypothetical protein
MNQENLTPEQSLKLISDVIADARNRFQENGIIYMMWGIMLGIAGIGQYLLIHFEYYSINYFPYFLMPAGGVISYLYYKKKAGSARNAISVLIGRLWLIVLVNLIVLGFLFSTVLGEYLVPVILQILAVSTITSGIAVKENVIQVAGISINILGFATFFIDYEYHPLVIAITGIVFTFIPGLILSRKNRDQ